MLYYLLFSTTTCLQERGFWNENVIHLNTFDACAQLVPICAKIIKQLCVRNRWETRFPPFFDRRETRFSTISPQSITIIHRKRHKFVRLLDTSCNETRGEKKTRYGWKKFLVNIPNRLETLNLLEWLSLIYLSLLVLEDQHPCFEIIRSDTPLFGASEAPLERKECRPHCFVSVPIILDKWSLKDSLAVM